MKKLYCDICGRLIDSRFTPDIEPDSRLERLVTILSDSVEEVCPTCCEAAAKVDPDKVLTRAWRIVSRPKVRREHEPGETVQRGRPRKY